MGLSRAMAVAATAVNRAAAETVLAAEIAAEAGVSKMQRQGTRSQTTTALTP